MFFALLHEIGHMVTGILLGFKPNNLEIMPVGLSIGFEGNVDNYNKKIGKTSILTLKKMIIALNGPITNLIFVVIFSIFSIKIFEIQRETIIYANILIGLFNLLPIYPLDGGRILKYILKILYGNEKTNNYIMNISYLTVVLLTAISSITILIYKNLAILIILFYLWYIVLMERKKYENKKKLYERIRNLQIEH
ncbi:MAG: site-2 protease family protein [Clostridia bacterium]|nr:site-2 protease family protein [Clostridia bacterium]